MHEPTALPRFSVVALAAFVLLLPACQREAEKTPSTPVEAAREAPPGPPVALPPPALSRADLLRAMNTAASEYAAGQSPATDGLAGRRFAVRQAFGCNGPVAASSEVGDGLARWSWKTDRESIELSLAPGDWTGSALVSGASADWEAVEGLWLTRPWLQAETCPGVQADPLASGPPAPSPQTMGLAAVFEAQSSRLGQRNGRAYSFVVRGKPGQPLEAPTAGYRLVLEGRLTSFTNGRAISCRAASPEQRPVCIAAASLDRVAFEDASGTMLSEWRPG